MYLMIDKYTEALQKAGNEPKDSTCDKIRAYMIRHRRMGGLGHK